MAAKRLLALLSVGLVVGLLSIGTGPDVYGQAKKDDKKDTKKDEKKEPPAKEKDSWPKVKGTIAKIVKVDAAKRMAEFNINGKVTPMTLGDDVQFFGPQGGKAEGDGFKDDRFVVGRNVKLVMEGMKVKELHFDYRPRKDDEKKDAPKKDAPKKEEKK